MAAGDNTRIQEGALSALKTPTNPPVPPKLVPLERPSGDQSSKGSAGSPGDADK